MAKTKPTQEDVELARIKTGLEKTRIICNTFSLCVALLAGTVCVDFIAGAAVKISDKPAWLTFALALLCGSVPPSAMAWRLRMRLKDKVIVHGFSTPPAGQDEPSPRSEGEVPE